MKNTKKLNKLVAGLMSMAAFSSVSYASTFADITIDGDFSDWAGIPVAATDVTGDGDPADFTDFSVANDDDFLYIRFTLDEAAALNVGGVQLFIAIDNDNNTATGFDVFGLGAVGSEVGWQNDFPFQQSTGVFNSGSIDNGGATIAPFNSTVTGQEIALPRSATFASDGTSIFPNDTIGIGLYTNGGTTTDDFIGGANYTFAVPEPSSVALLLSMTALGFVGFNRRRG